MTDKAEDICPQCHLPMHRDDARSYGYGGPTHEVSRCVELLLFANRAQAAKMEHMRVEIEMLRDHINTETKDYVRLRNTAAKSVHRKIALRQLNKAHEVACLTMELMARRLNQAQGHLRGDTP